MNTAVCPECHSDVIIDDEVYVNDLVSCANCGADLEIVALAPIELRQLKDEEQIA